LSFEGTCPCISLTARCASASVENCTNPTCLLRPLWSCSTVQLMISPYACMVSHLLRAWRLTHFVASCCPLHSCASTFWLPIISAPVLSSSVRVLSGCMQVSKARKAQTSIPFPANGNVPGTCRAASCHRPRARSTSRTCAHKKFSVSKFSLQQFSIDLLQLSKMQHTSPAACSAPRKISPRRR